MPSFIRDFLLEYCSFTIREHARVGEQQSGQNVARPALWSGATRPSLLRRHIMTSYQHAIVDGSKIFYREAGSKTAPTILLLHGFPTSSHMFRNLIPALADRYHVVAPDLPGFGFSDAPD